MEDRVVGQDRLIDAHRQLRPVGDAVVDGVVNGRESGPVAVQVADGVLGIKGVVPQLPRGFVLRRGRGKRWHQHDADACGEEGQDQPGCQ